MNVRKSGIAANMSIGLHQTWVRSQVLGPPKANFKRGNAKKSVKKVDRARLEAPN